MVIAFNSLFYGDYEGGANWLEVTLLSLGLLPDPPECVVVGTSKSCLPASLRQAGHVRPYVIGTRLESKANRVVQHLRRRALGHEAESRDLTRLADELGVNLWVGLYGFPGLGTRRRLLICYPDFQHHHFPQFFDDHTLSGRRAHWQKVAARADGILTLSATVAHDAESITPEVKGKTLLSGLASLLTSDQLSLNPDEIGRHYGLPQDYFIVCGQFWIHKNHRVVLEALDFLRTNDGEPPIVVFTGRPNDPRHPDAFSDLLRYVNTRALHEYCRFLGVISRSHQLALMRGARAVVQPSLIEGRGAVSGEAALLGTQLLYSDIPVHRELDLPGAIFFPANDKAALAGLLKRTYPKSLKPTDLIVADSARDAYQYASRLSSIFSSFVTQ